MDLLKAQLARLNQQLAGLTISQRMLAGTLVAIMVMTLFWWTRYAGDPEMQPLLNQSFSQADISQITAHLASKNIQYSVVGDKIMIPSDRKLEALGDLGFAHLLPEKTDTGFDDIVQKMNPFDSAEKTDRMWTEGKQRTLAQIIETFPGVDHVNVMLDSHEERSFSGHDVTPSAGISITTHGDVGGTKGKAELASAAADLVAGAQSGLARNRINVIINGSTVPLADSDSPDAMPDGDAIIDTIQKHESMYNNAIRKQLGFINGLFVSVLVNLNTKHIDTHETIVDPKQTVHLSVTEEEHNTETNTPQAPSEPGAVPNLTTNGELAVGASAPAPPSATSTENESKSAYQNDFSKKIQNVVQGPGDAPPVSAAIRVPRTYFISTYKLTHSGKEPDDAALTLLMSDEMGRIRQEVKNCTGINSDDAVSVNAYSVGEAETAQAGVETAAATPVSMLLSAHGKELGVGLLAAVSLFLMMMMVRKANPVVAAGLIASVDVNEKARGNLAGSDNDLAGEVGDGGQTLEGVEIDSEEAKTQQMISQVSTMVAEDPDAAATLVKRWLAHA